MICPSKFCKAEIPENSRYCNQCGIQILKCTKCGAIGISKFCGECGELMKVAGESKSVSADSGTETEDLSINSKSLTIEEVLALFDELVGMENVKIAVKELAQTISIDKQHENFPAMHNFVLIGNPGTGKTTVARLLGKLFNAIGLLPIEKVYETDRSRLVGQYVGETSILVNKAVDEAIGGVLFIDEAYTLIEGEENCFGREAIDTLLKRMEDDRGQFVVILAGYKDEMKGFLDANPGLNSRFAHVFNIEDYNADELTQLFSLYAKRENYQISEDAQKLIREEIQKIWENKDNAFANARTIRNFFDDTICRMSSRVATLPVDQRTSEVLTTITAEDVSASEEN